MTVTSIGEAVRDLRLQKNLTQADILKRTGLKTCYVSRVERSRTIPSVETLNRLVGAMDLTLSQFFAVIEKGGCE
jgi:transcriptional regulator with XRE-family HTH domain